MVSKAAGFRHEIKYLLNMPDAAILRMRLAALLRRDPNAPASGGYHVRSLYFDDYWNSAYHEKEDGLYTRKKYRLRIYDFSDRQIRLERKTKVGAYIKKESAPLTRAQVEALLAGEYAFLEKQPYPLLTELYYECVSRLLRPRVIVDYNREPFLYPAGDVRITFDRHVRAGMGRLDLFDAGLPTVEVLPGDQMILEVKYTSFLPSLVRVVLTPHAASLTSASKFLLCCNAAVRTQNLPRAEGLQWFNRR